MRAVMRTIFYFIVSASLFLFGAVSSASASSTFTEIRIFSSEALAKPVREIGYTFQREHPNVQLHYEFAASGVFVTGILQGIPPDLFLSAGTKYQDQLTEAGFINFPDTVAYSHLVAATSCYPPPCCEAPGYAPLRITQADLISRLMDPNIKLTIASPTLSTAGRYTEQLFRAIDRKTSGAFRTISKHAVYVLDAGLVARAIEHRDTNLGILYASQVAGLRREGKCVTTIPIPDIYNKQIPFAVSILNKSKFHFIGPERERLDKDLRNLYLSKTGQRIFAKWGFEPAK